jgi:hypothetical protein
MNLLDNKPLVLILYVNLMGPQDTQTADQTFLSMSSVRVFQKRLAFELVN